MRLDVACGRNPHPDCDTFMDANPEIPGLDHYGDAMGPLPWADGSASLVVARDILEHIPYRFTGQALAEWARLLCPGGRLYVQVPDFRKAAETYLRHPRSLVTSAPPEFHSLPAVTALAWRLMGGQDDGAYALEGDDWRLNAHYALFDHPSLRWHLERAGLAVEKMATNPFPNICCWAVKP